MGYVKGIFKARPNRFIAEVEVGSRVEKAHVPNTGRCKELLVEGATVWDSFWKITLPMLSPIILLVIVYTIIAANAEYGPVISYIMYQGFDLSEFEYSAAMGWSFFAIMLVVIGLVFLVMKPFIDRVTKRD